MPRRSHDDGLVRLNKLLAGKGVASRRHVEEMIIEGRIRVDGELATEKGLRVRPGARIEVDGRVVGDPPPLAWVALHKPRGYVCTKEDSRDRPIVMDLLPSELAHLHPVGRLDGDVSGLLLFTNEGELTHRLTHPRYGIEKVYQGRTTSPMRPQQAQALEDGIELEDGPSYPAKCRTLAPSGSGSLVELRIHEGRKHQVKRMFEAVGNPLIQLERVAVGPVELADLGRGRYRPLTPYEVIELHKRTMLPIPKGLAKRSRAEAAPERGGEGEAPKAKATRPPRGDAPRTRTRGAQGAREGQRPRDEGAPAAEGRRQAERRPHQTRLDTEKRPPRQPREGAPPRREGRGPREDGAAERPSRGRSGGRQSRERQGRPEREDRRPPQGARQGPSAWGVQEGIGPTRKPPERPPAWGGAEKPAGRPARRQGAAPGGRPQGRRERQGPPAWGEGGGQARSARPGRGARGESDFGPRGPRADSDRPQRPTRDTSAGRQAQDGRPRRAKRPGGQGSGRKRPPRAE